MSQEAAKQRGLRCIKRAIDLEESSQGKSAYMEYSQGILFLMSALLDDVRGSAPLLPPERRKLVTCARESIDRIVCLVDKDELATLGDDNINGDVSKAEVIVPHLENTEEPKSPVIEEAILRVSTLLSTPPSPLEMAREENRRLLNLYQSRYRLCPPSQQQNLSLQLQRQLAENFAIAKEKHEAFIQRSQERKRVCEEMAAKKFKGSESPHRQKLYSVVLQYEETSDWCQQFHASLENHQEDLGALSEKLVHQVLRHEDHPLANLLGQMLDQLVRKCNSLETLDTPDNPKAIVMLRNILAGIREDLKLLWDILVATYQQLDSHRGQSSSRKALQEVYFGPLWSHLLPVFREANKKEEVELAQGIANLRVSKEDFMANSPCQMPEMCGEHFLRLARSNSPADKLKCLVDLVQSLCRMGPQDPKSLGADDLLPLLTGALVWCGGVQIFSEAHLMEEFIPADMMNGQEGYCLTSLQTVIGYIRSRANS